jgi:hypothetical protein
LEQELLGDSGLDEGTFSAWCEQSRAGHIFVHLESQIYKIIHPSWWNPAYLASDPGFTDEATLAKKGEETSPNIV